MLALLVKGGSIIEDILWEPEVKAYHIGNKTDFSRPFSETRLFCPWTLEPLEGTLKDDIGDLDKARSAVIERLHPKGQPTHDKYIDKVSGDWEKYLTALHTWANYKLWLTRCSGSRNIDMMMQGLEKDPSVKLYYNKENGREKFLTNMFSPNSTWSKEEHKEINVGIPAHSTFEELTKAKSETGFNLGCIVKQEKSTEANFYVVRELNKGLNLESGRYITNDEYLKTKFSREVLSFGIIEDKPARDSPSKVKHLQINNWNSGHKDNTKWKEVQTSKEQIKKQKDEENLKRAEELDRLEFIKPNIWKKILDGKAWHPTDNIYNQDKFDDSTWYPGRGNPEADTWIIGLYPSTAERDGAKRNSKTGIRTHSIPRVAIGPSGTELDNQIKIAELDPEKDVFIDNILRKYKPPKSKAGVNDRNEQTWLLQALICHYKPKKIICLGADVFKVFVGNKKSFNEFRGKWLPSTVNIDPKLAEKLKIDASSHDVEVSTSYHPSYALRSEHRHTMGALREDMKTILSGKSTKEEEEKLPALDIIDIRTPAEVTTFGNEIEFFAGINNYTYSVGVDTESWTIGDHRNDKLVSIQIGVLFYDKDNNLVPSDKYKVGCIIYKEMPDPTYFSYSDYKQNRREIQEFSFFNVEGENTAIHDRSIAIYKESDLEKVNEIQEKQKCNVYAFRFDKCVQNIEYNDPVLATALTRLFHGPRCKDIGMTNTNHDRARLEHMSGLDFSTMTKPISDTIIGEHIINEANNERGLKASVKRWLGWGSYEGVLNKYREDYRLKDIAKEAPDGVPASWWILTPWSMLRPYAALDAIGTALVRHKHEIEMERQRVELQGGRTENTLRDAFVISCNALNGIYQMQVEGMPVGDKGLEKLSALEAFYEEQEKIAVENFQKEIFNLTGIKECSPTSSDHVGAALFGESSPLPRMGMRPWKESGSEGRLWDDIPVSERKDANPAVDAESLEILASNCPDKEIQKVLMQIADTKKIVTIRNNFIVSEEQAAKGKGLKGKISKASGNMHTNYAPTLDTARCRSKPNLSTLPNNEIYKVEQITGIAPPCHIRDMVQAPEGTYLLSRDWDTAEVLMLGYLSQDPNMLDIIAEMRNGQDFHARIAMKAFPQINQVLALWENSPIMDMNFLTKFIPDQKYMDLATSLWNKRWEKYKETKIKPLPLTMGDKCIFVKEVFEGLRQSAKPVTFGVPYGRTGPQIQKQLNRQYYVDDVRDANGELLYISEEACNAMVDGYKEEFSVAWAYLVNQAELAAERSYLEDRWGYIRHFPKTMAKDQKMRKAYNYQIQHGVAVIMNQAMHQWAVEKRERNLKSYAYYTLYDAIGWVVYEDELQDVWETSLRVMCTDRPVAPDGRASKWKVTVDGGLKYGLASDKVPKELYTLDKRDDLNDSGLTKAEVAEIKKEQGILV